MTLVSTVQPSLPFVTAMRIASPVQCEIHCARGSTNSWLDKRLAAGLHLPMRAVFTGVFASLVFGTACGASPAPTAKEPEPEGAVVAPASQAQSAPAGEALASNPQSNRPSTEIPKACAGSGNDCYPPVEFVRSLCKQKYTGVAVVMFNKHAPWRHAFVKVKDVAPVNTYGGPNAPERLDFLEEVVLLRQRQPKQLGNMMVSDAVVTYTVLRFDGTCATLAEDEFMTKKPVVKPHYAPIVWPLLDGRVRYALGQDPKVSKAANAQNTACGGTFLAGGGRNCKEATLQLTGAIMSLLADGFELPEPSQVPAWAGASTAAKQEPRTCRDRDNC